MEIVIENRIRIKKPTQQLKQYIAEKLVIVNPKYLEAKIAGRNTYGVNEHIVNFAVLPDSSLLVPRGLRAEILKQIDIYGVPHKIVDKRSKFEFRDINSSKINYKPYQYDAVVKLITSAPEGMLVAPAGSGKTVMGLSLIPLTGQPTLWLTHTGPLVEQVIERAGTFLPNIGEIGLIGMAKWAKGDLLTIGMIQTLIRNPQRLAKIANNFGMVIVDESHHIASRTFTEVVTSFNPYYLYGLTATPYRRDKLEPLMFQAIGPPTSSVSIARVEKAGGIIIPTIKCRYFYHPYKIDDNNIQRIIRENIVGNDVRNKMIVNDVVNEAKAGCFCIVISDRRDHCDKLFTQISKQWPATGIATGKYAAKHIKREIEKLNNNEITVLVATSSLLAEGFDAAFLNRAFIGMPFRAKAKTEQLIGRVQRTYKGKRNAVVYDYIDMNIGILENQFFSKHNGRLSTYRKLGVIVE